MTLSDNAISRTSSEIGSRVLEFAGGRARLKVVLLLGSVLGLDSADKAALSAIADSLKDQFHLNNTEIGLLVAVTSLAGTLCTLPVGTLVDRVSRKNVLLGAIALWTVAIVVSGFASSFLMLLLTRLFLGAVTAAAAPAVASLIGDFFPARARARVYGTVLSGELVGIGVGFFLSGEISTFAGWRWSLYLLGLPSVAIGVLIWRFLPEPARGGQGYIHRGQDELRSQTQSGAQDETPEEHRATATAGGNDDASARTHRRIREAGFRPRHEIVIHENPAAWSLWRTLRYLVRIPTYRLLVAASALGYFFFAGIRAFGMIFITSQYGLSRGLASPLVLILGVGAIVGVISGGRLSNWLLERGWLHSRVVVPGVALLLAALLTAPAIWTSSAVLGFALLTLGTAALAAANPPLDAARLDIIHARLWGRAESGRMALRGVLEGLAPILFGWVSGLFGDGGHGLQWTFSIMLIPVLAASSLAIPARRSYATDVATADASARAIREAEASE